MINLSQIPSVEMKKIVKLMEKKERYEKEIAKILKAADKKSSRIKALHKLPLPRSAQPSLRDLITGIIKKAGKPLSVSDIYQASLDAGYCWRSAEPLKALTVKLYTDKTFMRSSPGRFSFKPKE